MSLTRSRYRIVLLGTMAALLAASGPAVAAPGDLDATFSSDGKKKFEMGTGNNYGFAVTLQEDGRIVMGGRANGGTDFGVARLRPGGPFDKTFSEDGKATQLVGDYGDVYDVAIDARGRIMTVGYSGVPGSDGYDEGVGMARFLPDGAPDERFSGDGVKLKNFEPDAFEEGRALAIQEDGRIVVAGNVSGANYSFLARFRAGGPLDTTFGSAGVQVLTSQYVEDVAIQDDNRIVIAGRMADGAMTVARFLDDGSPDEEFGTDGVWTRAVGDFSAATGVALRGNGKLVVGGTATTSNDTDLAVVQLLPGGTEDLTFGGGDGEVTTPVAGQDLAEDVGIDSEGRILLGGSTIPPAGAHMTAVRYRRRGRVDTTFGEGDGIALVSFGPTAYGRAMTVQPDDKVVLVGEASGTNSKWAVARLEA